MIRKASWLLAFLGVGQFMLAGVAAALASDLTLWHDFPVRDWQKHAFFQGNGRLGCAVHGGVDREVIQFNEDSLWTGDSNPSGDYASMGAYQNFGEVVVHLKGLAGGENYRRELNLATAVHTVSYEVDGVGYRRETVASAADNVIVSHWTADRDARYSGRIELRDAHEAVAVAHGNQISCTGKLDNGLNYESRVQMMHDGGRIRVVDQCLEFEGCDSLTVLLAAGTDYVMDPGSNWRGELPAGRLEQQLRAAADRSFEQLLARHVEDYQGLFKRVTIDVGTTGDERRRLPLDQRIEAYRQDPDDPDLEEALFQYGRYLLIACSRPGTLPANLQGLWNHVNNPPWHSDYHTNINIQMNYWLAEPANLAECHRPLIALTAAMRKPAREATRASFGDVRGFTYRTSHNIFGGQGWKWNIPGSAWYCQHLWEHYAFGGDKRYLRETAYPIMKEVCQFWEDHLKALPDGKLVAPNGWSPEHGPREDGVAHDQQIIWDLFTNVIAAADELGIDRAYRDRVAELRQRLDGPRIGRWGQLQEWRVDRDDPNDRHRHTSHLFALYPGRQISVRRTPELSKAAMVSLEARGETGDSRRSWTWPWRCAMWARLIRPEEAHRMIVGLLHHNMLPNLITTHPPLQLDGSFGITAGICEMLLQSHAGELQLLPACPEAWPAGQFTGLRARGGFIVDARWKDRRVTQAKIRSPLGGPLVVVHGDERRTIETVPGDVVELQFE